jgi:NAD(P)-dependent dehydrogenase (short-subunit alcohol dehydrogenase family)
MNRVQINDFRDKAVLITGGTAGIGLATGLAFGRQGARCTLTYRWGSADEDEIRARFAVAGAPEPRLVQADVKSEADLAELAADLRRSHERLEVFVSGVAAATAVRGLDDYDRRALTQSLELTAWPLFAYLRRLHAVFGSYPRYVVGLSSNGPDSYQASYDFVAASKAVLETLCRYASAHLYQEDVRINVVRAGWVFTDSLRGVFGEEIEPFVQRYYPESIIPAGEVADAVLALCSGLMDAVRGQVLAVDHGAIFADNLMRLFDNRDTLFPDRRRNDDS